MLLNNLWRGWRDAGHPWLPDRDFPSTAVHPLCPPALQKESKRFPGPGLWGSTGRGRRRRRRRALITEAQRGPMAVAPAAGHLGESLTPTLSKNKKIRKGNWATIGPVYLQGPGSVMEKHRWDFLTWICCIYIAVIVSCTDFTQVSISCRVDGQVFIKS